MKKLVAIFIAMALVCAMYTAVAVTEEQPIEVKRLMELLKDRGVDADLKVTSAGCYYMLSTSNEKVFILESCEEEYQLRKIARAIAIDTWRDELKSESEAFTVNEVRERLNLCFRNEGVAIEVDGELLLMYAEEAEPRAKAQIHEAEGQGSGVILAGDLAEMLDSLFRIPWWGGEMYCYPQDAAQYNYKYLAEEVCRQVSQYLPEDTDFYWHVQPETSKIFVEILAGVSKKLYWYDVESEGINPKVLCELANAMLADEGMYSMAGEYATELIPDEEAVIRLERELPLDTVSFPTIGEIRLYENDQVVYSITTWTPYGENSLGSLVSLEEVERVVGWYQSEN